LYSIRAGKECVGYGGRWGTFSWSYIDIPGVYALLSLHIVLPIANFLEPQHLKTVYFELVAIVIIHLNVAHHRNQ